MGTYSSPDNSDVKNLQKLTDTLSAALQVSISIRNSYGERFTRDSRYGSFYYDVLEPSPAGLSLYGQFVSGLLADRDSVSCVRHCPALGLTAAVISISSEKAPLASILVEDVRLEEDAVSDGRYREIARSLQIDEDAYLDGIHSLPLTTSVRFHHILDLLALLSQQLYILKQTNLNLLSAISSLENQESLYRQEKNILEELAERDSMTGLYNWHKFEEMAAFYSTQKDREICMISADANFLKLTNDIFGHEAGDLLLTSIARIMGDLAKSDWLVARCGGDEFRVILPDTRLETALDYCRRVARNCQNDKSLTLPLSVALGAAEWNSEKETLHDCFSRADAKMYQNKTALKHELRIPDYIMERLYDRQILNREVVELTSSLTYEFALYLRFSKERARETSLAARYQDIGMAKLPEFFVIRGQSRTQEETTQMHLHVTHSYTMARQFDELYKIADIIHSSHEKWNGSGYPGSLKGTGIPLESRVIRLTSDYVSKTHPTIRGGYHTEEEILQKLRDDRGTLYDPNLTHKFLEFLKTSKDRFSPAEKPADTPRQVPS